MKKIFLFLLFVFAADFVQSQALSVQVSSTTSCANDGTATATVTGGVPPYSYLWNSTSPIFVPQFTPTASNLPPGFYSLKVTDAIGTIFNAYAYVEASFQIQVITTPDTCLQSSGTADVSVVIGAIVPPLTYLWSNNATTQLVTGLSTGDYAVTVTMGNGCFVNSDAVDSVGIGGPYSMGYVGSVANFQVTFTSTNSNCLNGTATANVVGGQPPYNYQWQTNPIQTTVQATGLSRYKYYDLVTTDATGCNDTSQVYIGSNSNFYGNISSIADTCGFGHGSLTAYGIGGVPPYTYLWDNGNTTPTRTNLIGGNSYSVTITDANGCESIINSSLFNLSPLTITTSQNPSSCSASTGNITAIVNGGLPPYNYLWQTQPPQLTATAVNLPAGQYSINVIDQNGCIIDASASLNDNSNMNIAITTVDDQCHNSVGSATVTVINGQPGYSYSWDTNPVQTSATASGLEYGIYKVIVTDALGCIRRKTIYVGNQSPLILSTTATPASCIYTADGSATAVVTGGTLPYSYQWSDGSSNATASSILSAYYSVNVTDANGCDAISRLNVGYNSIFPCASELKGKVFNDQDLDCTFGGTDLYVPQVWVNAGQSGPYRLSDSNGDFNFILSAAGNYNLDLSVPPWYQWVCNARPLTVNVPVLGTTVTNDIATRGSAVDLAITSFSRTAIRPGFDCIQFLTYKNQGSLTCGSGEITVNFDSLLTYVSSNPSPVSFNPATHQLKYQFSNIYPFQIMQNIEITYQVPANVAIGNTIAFHDTIINSLNNDTVLYNNSDTRYETVVGSYDPNDIQVYPKGSGVNGDISASDSMLTYTVRFQNTGTYPAQNIIVKVQTDQDLNLNTFEFLAASAQCKIEADENGLLTFTFIGINLADSFMNETASHGFLAFSIKQKPGLSPGTQFSCNADIYFDFNAPVPTNVTLNTLTGIKNPDVPFVGIQLYPNPASDYVLLQSSAGNFMKSVTLLDATGRELINRQLVSIPKNQFELDLQSLKLSAGIYFLSVEAINGNQMLKFIKK